MSPAALHCVYHLNPLNLYEYFSSEWTYNKTSMNQVIQHEALTDKNDD